jgi:tetratricopeptide (TPR) repeat protein
MYVHRPSPQLGPRADFRDRARLLTDLAWARYRLGDLERAAAHAADSVAVGREAGDGGSSIRGMTVLAVARGAQGRHREVLTIFEEIVDLSRAHGPLAHTKALINLGETNLILERYEASTDCYREVARIASAAQLRPQVAEAQRGIATSLAMLGRCAEAVPIAEQAVEAMRENGHPVRLVVTLAALAHARMGCGQAEQAIDHLVEAIQLCEGIAGTYQAAQVYNALGEAHRLLDDHPSARDSHREAFELAGRAGARDERARALVGLGDAHAALGDPSSARECWQEALDEYADMGLPAAARVEARLREGRTARDGWVTRTGE